MNNAVTLLFRVVEPSRKSYQIFTNGRISGFPESAVVSDYFPLLSALGRRSHAVASPISNETDSLAGAAQLIGVIATDLRNGEKICVALAEK